MINLRQRNVIRQRVHTRIREKMSGTAERPRLNVYRSLNHIYTQLIDDLNGVTIVSASSFGKKGEERPTAETSQQPRKSASLSPSAPRKRASRRWSSIVAATSITVASRPSPTLPAKLDSSSKEKEFQGARAAARKRHEIWQ